jgi:hypothetical protein
VRPAQPSMAPWTEAIIVRVRLRSKLKGGVGKVSWNDAAIRPAVEGRAVPRRTACSATISISLRSSDKSVKREITTKQAEGQRARAARGAGLPPKDYVGLEAAGHERTDNQQYYYAGAVVVHDGAQDESRTASSSPLTTHAKDCHQILPTESQSQIIYKRASDGLRRTA